MFLIYRVYVYACVMLDWKNFISTQQSNKTNSISLGNAYSQTSENPFNSQVYYSTALLQFECFKEPDVKRPTSTTELALYVFLNEYK